MSTLTDADKTALEARALYLGFNNLKKGKEWRPPAFVVITGRDPGYKKTLAILIPLNAKPSFLNIKDERVRLGKTEEVECEIAEFFLEKGCNVVLETNRSGYRSRLDLRLLSWRAQANIYFVSANKVAKIANNDGNRFVNEIKRIARKIKGR